MEIYIPIFIVKTLIICNYSLPTARHTMSETIPVIRNEKDLVRDQPDDYEFGVCGLFLRASNLHVFRAVEPSLKLTYLEVTI